MADIDVTVVENEITADVTKLDVGGSTVQNVITTSPTTIEVVATTNTTQVQADTTQVVVTPTIVQNVITATVGAGGGGSDSNIARLENGWPSNITLGQVVYQSSTDGIVRLAQANNPTTFNAFGLVAQNFIGNGQTGAIQTSGTITGLSGLLAGTTYYLDTVTAGNMITTEPTGAGQYVVEIGQASSATQFLIRIRLVVSLN